MREAIVDGTIMIDVDGAVVGQVNGLAVLMLGDHMFGKPSRITAKTFLGQAGVVNIEREAKLSGKIHDKGVLIINGYLGGRYAQNKPLSLTATITFEQNYDGIDGDSASSTEVYALLSALSGLPINQGIAVTGSVNQHGEIQAIGGATAKIEGFFDVCREKGLTGAQGVIIPEANVHNLMLREDVVEAVADGQFHIYPVRTVDEGIAILTGVEAGERDEDGKFPEDTVNRLVDDGLRRLASGSRPSVARQRRRTMKSRQPRKTARTTTRTRRPNRRMSPVCPATRPTVPPTNLNCPKAARSRSKEWRTSMAAPYAAKPTPRP